MTREEHIAADVRAYDAAGYERAYRDAVAALVYATGDLQAARQREWHLAERVCAWRDALQAQAPWWRSWDCEQGE